MIHMHVHMHTIVHWHGAQVLSARAKRTVTRRSCMSYYLLDNGRPRAPLCKPRSSCSPSVCNVSATFRATALSHNIERGGVIQKTCLWRRIL